MIPLGLELVAGYSPFVVDSWLRTYRRLYRVDGLASRRWYEGQRKVIEPLLGLVHCAVRPSAPNTVHAWICGEPGTVHYVYVAHELRRHGIGRALVETVAGSSGVVTHCLPRAGRGALRGFTYDPFALVEALRKAA